MVLGKEIDLALVCEKEGGGDRVATPGLVDVGRNPPNTISKIQSKLWFATELAFTLAMVYAINLTTRQSSAQNFHLVFSYLPCFNKDNGVLEV